MTASKNRARLAHLAILAITSMVGCVVARSVSSEQAVAEFGGTSYGSGGSDAGTCSCGCGSSCCDCGSDAGTDAPPACDFHDNVCGGSCPTSPVFGTGEC